MHVSAPLIVLSCCAMLAVSLPPDKKLVCYHTSWSRYRVKLGGFTPQNINPYLCTHIHYAIANSNEDQQLGPADPFADFTKKGYAEFAALKEVNPALKTVLMLGGSDATQQDYFRMIMSNASTVQRFVSNAIQYLRKHKFDGVDIDWKEPTRKTDHAGLLEALAAGFKAEPGRSESERLTVSATLTANLTLLRSRFQVARAARAADYLTLIGYDLHSSAAAATSHHAPLLASRPTDADNVDFFVRTFRRVGVDVGRLLLGVPTFGVTFTLGSAGAHGFGAPATGAGHRGKFTGSPGSLAFYEICEHLSMDGWQAFRPRPDVVGPYAVRGDQWVAYDDECMMRAKGRYVRDNGLGGVAVWTLAQDDFRGLCTGRPYPLIEAVKAAMLPDRRATSTTQAPPPTPAYDNSVVFACPLGSGNSGRFPKVDDCTKFIVCVDGLPQLSSCPQGDRFDAVRRLCNTQAVCSERAAATVTRFAPTSAPVTQGPPVWGVRARVH